MINFRNAYISALKRDEIIKKYIMQGKNWCFTINNWSEDEFEKLSDLEPHFHYMVLGKEIGENGTPHIQGYVQFKKKLRLNQVKAHLGQRAHCEISRGTAMQASIYCKKEDDWVEFGTMQLQGTRDYVYQRIILAQ